MGDRRNQDVVRTRSQEFCYVSRIRSLRPSRRVGGTKIRRGRAGDPHVPAKTSSSMIQAERDADVGRLVHNDGVYPWW